MWERFRAMTAFILGVAACLVMTDFSSGGPEVSFESIGVPGLLIAAGAFAGSFSSMPNVVTGPCLTTVGFLGCSLMMALNSHRLNSSELLPGIGGLGILCLLISIPSALVAVYVFKMIRTVKEVQLGDRQSLNSDLPDGHG